MDRSKQINVHTIESIFEMDMLKDALDKEDIPYTIKEHRDTAYDGLFILQKGFASEPFPMWHIQRTNDPSSLIGGIRFASFIGGGGKTTLIEYLARSCVARHRSVAVVTTTKIFALEPFVVFDDWVKRDPPQGLLHTYRENG